MAIDWKPAWLLAYREHGTVVAACKVAGISRTACYEARDRDPEFAEAWDSCERTVTKLLEETAVERALNGSDRLMEFMLKARRPERYRESLKIDGTITHLSEKDLDDEISGFLAAADAGAAIARGEDPPSGAASGQGVAPGSEPVSG